jgi:hypothetical protein
VVFIYPVPLRVTESTLLVKDIDRTVTAVDEWWVSGRVKFIREKGLLK